MESTVIPLGTKEYGETSHIRAAGDGSFPTANTLEIKLNSICNTKWILSQESSAVSPQWIIRLRPLKPVSLMVGLCCCAALISRWRGSATPPDGSWVALSDSASSIFVCAFISTYSLKRVLRFRSFLSSPNTQPRHRDPRLSPKASNVRQSVYSVRFQFPVESNPFQGGWRYIDAQPPLRFCLSFHTFLS